MTGSADGATEGLLPLSDAALDSLRRSRRWGRILFGFTVASTAVGLLAGPLMVGAGKKLPAAEAGAQMQSSGFLLGAMSLLSLPLLVLLRSYAAGVRDFLDGERPALARAMRAARRGWLLLLVGYALSLLGALAGLGSG